MKINELHNQPVKPDTYEASMALNQLLKIGKHAIKIHNMIDDRAEMEAWVAKKIDLAGDYVKKVHGYMQGEKAGLYDDGGMTESRHMIGDYAREIESGRIVRIVDFTPDEDGDIYTISYGEDQGENDVFAKDLKFLDQTGADQEEISKFGEDAGDQDDWTKLLNAVAQRYGKEKARVIHDYAQHGTDSGRELMRDYGLTPGDGWEEDQPKWFKKFPWLEKLDNTSWMSRLVDIAGQGPEYGGAGYEYPKGLESLESRLEAKLREEQIDIFDFEKQDEYNDDQEKYGDVDKTPLTPQERQQFKQWLLSTANTYAQMAVDDGVDEIGEDLSDIEDQYHKFIPKIKEYLKQSHAKGNLEDFAGDVLDVEEKFGDPDMLLNDRGFRVAKDFSQHATNYEVFIKYASGDYTVKTIRGILDSIDDDPHISSAMLVFQTDFEGTPLQRKVSRVQASESVSEDAGDMDLIGDGAENLGLDPNKFDYYYDTSGAGYGEVRTKSGKSILQFEYDRDGDAEVSTMDNKTIANIKQGEQLPNNVTAKLNMIKEDAGEGHMSKSTLYHTAKYAIELMQMIQKGDDLEGWVQSKLNKAADYLQGVHNYEEYQKLNPYREELDASLMQKHAQVVQKNIDEILSKETKLDDIDTKPGMMRILAKRVNEVEKEIAKKTRKETTESGILYRAGVKKYGKAGMKAIQSAAAKGANHQEIGKIKDKHLKDDDMLDEGKIKDWAKSLAMAGVFVAGLAGVGSIQDAINNSVPAVKAMNTALELAQDQGNDELVKMIEKDIKDAKLRLDIGRDLNQVKYLQDKYSKFMPTEGLAYESKLAILLNQRLK